MGWLSDRMREKSELILNDEKFRKALERTELGSREDEAGYTGTIATVTEALSVMIAGLLTGKVSNAEVINKLKDDMDLLFYLVAEVAESLNGIAGITPSGVSAIKGLKSQFEAIIDTHRIWESNLSNNDNHTIQANTISDILKVYGDLRDKTVSAFDEYSGYNEVALSFLVLAILSNTIGQANIYIGSIAPRFIKYFDRSGNAALRGSLAQKMVALVRESEVLTQLYQPSSISWPDGTRLEISGTLHDGFVYKQFNTAKNEAGTQIAHKTGYSSFELADQVAEYEKGRKQFVLLANSIQILRSAIDSCNKYKHIIEEYIALID